MRYLWMAAFLSVLLRAQDIPSGTHMLLSLDQTLNTARAKAGDHVALRVAVPLVAAGKIVVPAGSYAEGVLTHVKRGGRIRGRAELQMQLLHFVTPNGKVIESAAVLPRVKQDFGDAKASRPSDRTALGVGGGVLMGGLLGGAATGSDVGVKVGLFGALGIGALQAVLRRGDDLELPRGTNVDFVMP